MFVNIFEEIIKGLEASIFQIKTMETRTDSLKIFIIGFFDFQIALRNSPL
jgi:hypothetical protein